MTKYGEGSQRYVKSAVKKYNKGKLKSGKAKVPVKSREQSIAIWLSKARSHGVKIPRKLRSA